MIQERPLCNQADRRQVSRRSMCRPEIKSKPTAKSGVDDFVRRIPQCDTFDYKTQLQTLRGRFLRAFIMSTIYPRICVLVLLLAAWAFTGAMLLCALVKRDSAAVPDFVWWFLIFNVLWGVYYVATPGDLTWPFLCRFYRETLTNYPYFRYNSCIFEDNNEVTNNSALAATSVPTDARAVFAFHPHGVLTCGFSFNGMHHTRFAESNVRWLVAENYFWFPMLRDLLSWLGCDNVTKKTFTKLMRDGRNIGFVPGGYEEHTLYERGKYRVFLRKRFGFIKLALQYGYKIYPGFTFGEEQTFHAFPYLQQFRLKLNEWKIPGAVYFGSKYCPLMPRSDVDLITVFGRAVQFPTIKNPTAEEVQEHQRIYIEALQGVFDRYKAKYAADPTAVLEIL